jgi:hypothetical protein
MSGLPALGDSQEPSGVERVDSGTPRHRDDGSSAESGCRQAVSVTPAAHRDGRDAEW